MASGHWQLTEIFEEIQLETTLEYVTALCIFILGVCLYTYLALLRLSKRLTSIETALGVETELQRAETIAPDVEARIRAGNINQAITLHRSRYDISLGEAQRIINRHAASMA